MNDVRPIHFCDVTVQGERWPVFGWAIDGPAGTIRQRNSAINSAYAPCSDGMAATLLA